MPVYRYQAIDAQREPAAGDIEADSVQQAIARLEEQGLAVQSIAAADMWETKAQSSDVQQVVRFYFPRRLEAAKPLSPALRAYADELPDSARRNEIRRMAHILEQDSSVDAEAAVIENPNLWVPLVSAVAASDTPAQALQTFLIKVRQSSDWRRQWWLFLAYPALVLLIAASVFIVLSVVVIPGFVEVFEDFDLSLPVLTRWVIAIAAWINSGAFLIVLSIGTLILLLAFTLYWANILPRPNLRSASKRPTAIAHFASFVADLLQIGLPAGDAVRLAKAFTRTSYEKHSAGAIARRDSPSDLNAIAVGRSAIVRHALEQEMSTAARVGLLREVAAIYADRARTRVSWARGAAEPLAILFVGFVVAIVVLALFLPLVRLIDGLA